jgi:hypothetical protein
VLLAGDRDHHLVEMLPVTGSRSASANAVVVRPA